MQKQCFVLLLVLTTAACSHNETKSQLPGIADYLEGLSYSFYNPPRTDRGPLSVFRFQEAQSGKTVISSVCGQIFPYLEFKETKLTLPQQKSQDNISVQFAVSLVKDVLKAPATATAKWKSDSTVNVKYTDVRSVYVNEEGLYNADGMSRTISPQCYSALERISKSGEFKNNVFIVQSAIEVGGLEYDFSNTKTLDEAVSFLVAFKPISPP